MRKTILKMMAVALAALVDKDYAGAVAAYDNIDELTPDMRNNYTKANFLRGEQLFASGSYRDAAPFFRAGTKARPGVQVDMMLQTRKSVWIVEIKRRERIGEVVEEEVRQKVVRLGLPRDLSVRTVLVYEGKLSPSVVEDGYFDFAIPAETLLERG